MPHFKRNGDGTRQSKVGAGGGPSRPGSWFSPDLLVGNKQETPGYLKGYGPHGEPRSEEVERLDGLRPKANRRSAP